MVKYQIAEDGDKVTVTGPMYVCTFIRGRFNDTQEVRWTAKHCDVMTAARLMRELAEWLRQERPELL